MFSRCLTPIEGSRSAISVRWKDGSRFFHLRGCVTQQAAEAQLHARTKKFCRASEPQIDSKQGPSRRSGLRRPRRRLFRWYNVLLYKWPDRVRAAVGVGARQTKKGKADRLSPILDAVLGGPSNPSGAVRVDGVGDLEPALPQLLFLAWIWLKGGALTFLSPVHPPVVLKDLESRLVCLSLSLCRDHFVGTFSSFSILLV